MSRWRRGGTTLIELLIAIAVLALLIGFLLPAVQKVREAAARVNCSNNLKQMSHGFLSHHNARGYFPRGGTQVLPHYPSSADLSASSPLLREGSWSWAYLLLPYIDQSTLYHSTDTATVRATPVKTYYCPSRRHPRAYNNLAKIDYAGNAGDQTEGQNGLVMRSTHGVVRLADVIDGTSGTVLLGEKQLNRASFGRSLDDDEAYCTPGWNDDWEVYRWGAAVPAPDYSQPGIKTPSHVFGSAHLVGFYCAFADGSVRFVKYSVNPMTWRRACVRNDHQGFNQNES